VQILKKEVKVDQERNAGAAAPLPYRSLFRIFSLCEAGTQDESGGRPWPRCVARHRNRRHRFSAPRRLFRVRRQIQHTQASAAKFPQQAEKCSESSRSCLG
jgi:hypothetical protein